MMMLMHSFLSHRDSKRQFLSTVSLCAAPRDNDDDASADLRSLIGRLFQQDGRLVGCLSFSFLFCLNLSPQSLAVTLLPMLLLFRTDWSSKKQKRQNASTMLIHNAASQITGSKGVSVALLPASSFSGHKLADPGTGAGCAWKKHGRC